MKNIKYFILTFLLIISIVFIISCSTISKNSEIIHENTSRYGTINSDERWKGIINVTGDIDIYGGTLTIEPGTIVKFAAGQDDRKGGSSTPNSDPFFPNDPAISPSQISAITVYEGNLVAIGTPENRIIFTSSASLPKPGDWDSIQTIRPQGFLNVQFATVEYGYSGIAINDTADDAHITIRNNIIRNVVAAGINCGNSSKITHVSITLSGNDISFCGHEGIATYPGNNLIIENNILHDIKNTVDGGGAGVVIEGSNSIVRNNQFIRNRTGILIMGKDSKPSISNNTFKDNDEDSSTYIP